MKNVQIIDNADNCTYSLYKITDDLFCILFPDGHDIEYIESLEERLSEDEFKRICNDLFLHPIEKINACGIHGTLFYGLRHSKQDFYPGKRFYDDVSGFSAAQRKQFRITNE